MNLKRIALTSMSVFALTFSISSGVVAQTASDDFGVEVACVGHPTDVTVDATDLTALNLNDPAPQTVSNNVSISVDVGCYREGWSVDAAITPFTKPAGTPAGSPAAAIPGSWYSLDALSDTGYGVTANDGTFAPIVLEAENVLEKTLIGIPGGDGNGSGTWQGDLTVNSFGPNPISPAGIVQGDYTSTMTVSLTLDPLP